MHKVLLVGIGHSQGTTEQRRKAKMMKLAEEEAQRLAEEEEKKKIAAEAARKKDLLKKNKVDITALTANSKPVERDAKTQKYLNHQQLRLDAQDFLFDRAIDAKKKLVRRDKTWLELIERGKDALALLKVKYQAYLAVQSQAASFLFDAGLKALEVCIRYSSVFHVIYVSMFG